MTKSETKVPPNLLKGESVWRQLAGYIEVPWVRCLSLVLFGVGVHLPSLPGQFLWDDVALIRDNPFIKSPALILEAFRHYLFPDSYSGHYRPVQTISYIFDYLVWNTEPYGFHLSNVLWHVLSGVLLYFLLCRILGSLDKRWSEKSDWANGRLGSSAVAFVLALLWVVHPVHSAAVDYVSGRADSLSFFFASGGWLLFLRAHDPLRAWVRRGLFALAILSALLALCSRESGCLWVFVFLFYLFVFDRKPTLRTKFLVLSACLAVVALYVGLRQLPESRPENVRSVSFTPAMRGVLMLRALGDYGGLMVFPCRLHVERSVFEPASARNPANLRDLVTSEYLSITGVALLGVLAFGALRKGDGQAIRIFGATWFFVTYLPISNLFDLNATVAEHWLYLPSVGFLMFLAGYFIEMPVRFGRYATGFATIAVLALSARSAIRSSDWADPETFFRKTFAAGGSSSRIGVNLAVIYAMQGEHAKAEAVLRKVLQVCPDFPLARNNLGIALSQQGKTKEAETMFATASNSTAGKSSGYPRTWEAARNLARLRHRENNDAAAFSIMEKARRDYPGTWDLISFEAQLMRETHGSGAALSIVKSFVDDHWWHARASIALGGLLMEVGDLAKAEVAFQNASMLDVHSVEALNWIALLNMRQNKLEDAYKIQQRAISRHPDEPQQYLLLSAILEKMGRTAEAKTAINRVGYLRTLARLQPTAD